MNPRAWIGFFILILLVELVGIQMNNETIQFICKPLLMPVLIFYFLSQAKNKWIVGALLFSWIGDVLLMFQENNSSFFLFGLVSFLLAHICYIIFFFRIRIIEKI